MTTYDTAPLFADDEPGLLPAAGRLFGIAGATPETTQWRALRLQLVNWGGYIRTTVALDRDSTLLTGASGTGKSTLLDAYTTLMMPSDIPLNGASNQGAGRARGAEQRSILSYLRGQINTVTGDDGHERPVVTRGEKAATWGAIAMVFVNDHGQHYTVSRLYYVPVNGNVTTRLCTTESELDLASLEDLVPGRFEPKALRARGIAPHETYEKFFNEMFSSLGIGGISGDGMKALRLLARVQAGQQIRTVDLLYKEMVLERPDTYDEADTVLKHFAALDGIYQQMRQTRQKREILKDIETVWDRLTRAHHQIVTLTGYGADADGPSPLTLWSIVREADMVTGAQEANRERREQEEADLLQAQGSLVTMKLRLAPLKADYENNGGGRLEQLAREIEELRVLAEQRRRALAVHVENMPDLVTDGVDLADRAQFEHLQAQGVELATTFDQRRGKVAREVEEIDEQRWPLLDRKSQLGERLRALQGTRSRVGKDLNELRDQVCRAAGMNVADAPFIAELVAVAEEHRRWTTAVEVVLGGEARRMLVPLERLEDFSAAIDSLQLRGRLKYTGAQRGLALPPPAVEDTVAGKLEFKSDSPYRGWVAGRVAEPGLNAVCVEDARGLAGGGRRVTLTGQMRQGVRGEHGRWNQDDILGFNNKDLIEQTSAAKTIVEEQIDELDQQRKPLTDGLQVLERRSQQHARLAGVQFDHIDVRTPERDGVLWAAEHTRLLADSDRLATLNLQIAELEKEIADEEAERVLHGRKIGEIKTLADKFDGDAQRLEREEASLRGQGISLTDQQAGGISTRFGELCARNEPDDLDRWMANLATLRSGLRKTLADARTEQVRSSGELTGTFAAYLEKFPDPRLTVDVGCYEDFARIRQDLSDSQMAERQEEFRQIVVKWSGEDLVGLLKAIETSYLEIFGRLDPINAILRTLKFGPGGHYLHMNPRKKIPTKIVDFTAELRELASTATTALDAEQVERRYLRAARFLDRIRGPKDDRYDPKVSERDFLLDVRRNITIIAEEYDQGNELQATYASLSAKSGGETQELIAFIIGSALRYRLGDEDRARPRFAPVFLDEAFIKADPEHTERAVTAWSRLNFQLIVGAPLQMVTTLERHVNKILLTTKNQQTNESQVRYYNPRTSKKGD